MFDDLLEVGHNQKCFSGRVTNDTRMESWNLQTGQLQKTIQITPNMSIESLSKFSLTSGLFDDLLEVGHNQKCFSGRVTNDTRMESWNLQTGQLQKTIQITPNMSIESLSSFSLTSGLFDDVLEVGHDQECFSGRVTNDTREESWNLQIGQLQKTIQITPSMSIESLSKFSLTSGEYISIYLIPWIISTTKEKEVPTLQNKDFLILSFSV